MALHKESYSQFGEDSIAAAYFEKKSWARTRSKSVGQGVFVDIGSFHPINLSNTYYLYKQGWRGVSVDATPGVKESFDKERPEDTNIWAIVSSKPDSGLCLYTWGNSVYNTVYKEVADKLVAEGRVPTLPVAVKPPVITLEEVFSNHVGAKPCDLLSVDTEGHDLEVLRSNDWSIHRPELVIVEKHESQIQEILKCDIYRYMRSKGYELYAWAPPSLVFVRG